MMAKANEGIVVSEPANPEPVNPMELVENYGVRVGTCVGLVLLVVIAVVVYRARVVKREMQASMALGQARSVQELQDLLEEYPSVHVSPLAVLKLAKAGFDAGNYDMALSKYNEFKANFPDHQLALGAELGRIHCLEARAQVEEAAEAFAAVLAANENHFLAPVALFGRARCLEQLGQHSEARVLYEDFVAAHSEESPWTLKAEERLADIAEKLKNASGLAIDPVMQDVEMPPSQVGRTVTTNAPMEGSPESVEVSVAESNIVAEVVEAGLVAGIGTVTNAVNMDMTEPVKVTGAVTNSTAVQMPQ